jgi:hypothetical protein
MESQRTAAYYRSRAEFYRELADSSPGPKTAEQRRELAKILNRKAEEADKSDQVCNGLLTTDLDIWRAATGALP